MREWRATEFAVYPRRLQYLSRLKKNDAGHRQSRAMTTLYEHERSQPMAVNQWQAANGSQANALICKQPDSLSTTGHRALPPNVV